MLMLLSGMASELDAINDRIAAIDVEIKALAKADADMQRLMEIPGVGPTIATALVAAIGTGSSFGKWRDLAAWLGLMPRQITTSGKAKLVGTSKHGNGYLRKLFIHGARRVLHLVRDGRSPVTAWADGLKDRAHGQGQIEWLRRKTEYIEAGSAVHQQITYGEGSSHLLP